MFLRIGATTSASAAVPTVLGLLALCAWPLPGGPGAPRAAASEPAPGAGPNAGPVVPVVEVEDLPARAPEVRAEDFEAHVRRLASPALGGRMSTEPGAFAASAYVARALARAGLEPAGVDGTWFQPFLVPLPELGTDNRLTMSLGGDAAAGPRASRAFDVEREWNPMAMSPDAAAEGDLVFAGFGVVDRERGYDDYAGLSVEGRVVLVLRREPPREGPPSEHATFRAKVARASERGAAALLVVNDRRAASGGRDPLVHWSEPAGVTPGSALLPVAFVSRACAEALVAPLGRGLDALQAEIEAPAGPRRASASVPGVRVAVRTAMRRPRGENARNVVGLLPGRDPALCDEFVVVGAHHDHVGRGWFGSAGGPAAQGQIHPGADDNASGTAALLEIADALAAGPTRRSILFLSFSGEELGLLGSAHYVAQPLRPLAATVAMVNLDMVGRYDAQRTLNVGGVGTAPGLQGLVEAKNRAHGLALSFDPQGTAPSDSTSFFRKGIPVLFFFTGLHPEYHTPRDTADLVRAADGARVTSLALDVVRALADEDRRRPFTPPPPSPRGRAVLGIVPAGGGDAGGVVVAEAAEGGAAAAAGLRAGDVLTAVGKHLVKDVRDVPRALAGYKPGDKVLVKFLRDGEERSVEVTLGGR